MAFNRWTSFGLFLTYLLLSACAEIKQTGRIIGHTTRDVTREIGHGTRDAVKTIGHGTRRVTSNIKDESEGEEN
ncbi:MAG: hypothetical protein ACR65R_08465 [Methylomicrobium sp.]